MKLFDAHCHLPEGDLTAMLERAAAAGIVGMAVCGTSPNDWDYCIGAHHFFQGLENPPVIYPMIGIHPWFVGCRAGSMTPPKTAITDRGYNWEADFQALHKKFQGLEKAAMLWLGETGLDFSSFAKAPADKQGKFTNRAEQEECFAAHLDLARELDRSVAVHCVQAWGRLIEILKEHPAPRILLHAFSGAAELIPELTGLNCWFSFGRAVMIPKAKRARAAVVAVPKDRLLIETDSNGESEKLIHVAHAVADLRGVSVEEIADLTFGNAQTLFS